MKDRPIPFSGPMVRQILANLKDITRRTRGLEKINENPNLWRLVSVQDGLARWAGLGPCLVAFGKCPYGKPGDRLWVRETWAVYDKTMTRAEREGIGIPAGPNGLLPGSEGYWKRRIIYAADGDPDPVNPMRWKPFIYMPKWASRIWLEVMDVRVERLHEISGRDAAAEGFWLPPYDPQYPDGTFGITEKSMIDRFALTWRKLNDDRPGCGWDDNPWVWVVSFKPIETPKEVAA